VGKITTTRHITKRASGEQGDERLLGILWGFYKEGSRGSIRHYCIKVEKIANGRRGWWTHSICSELGRKSAILCPEGTLRFEGRKKETTGEEALDRCGKFCPHVPL